MSQHKPLPTLLKGYAMGAANVIPGVSGGTVAFVTGIFEPIINALKSFDVQAIQLLCKFRLKECWTHVNGNFLLPLGIGVVLSLVTLARLLEYLFESHEVLIWALFFGLILASVYYVGKKVSRWTVGPWIGLAIGVGIAAALAFVFKPAQENTNVAYLMICGVVAMCSMIIPGLSGSYVLLLMGNYKLVLGAVSSLTKAAPKLDMAGVGKAMGIIVPVGIGAVVGIIALSRLISWIFKNFHDTAVALLTGFVAGSLLMIWPWKDKILMKAADGSPMLDRHGEELIQGYDRHLPDLAHTNSWFAIALIALGIALVVVMERLGSNE